MCPPASYPQEHARLLPPALWPSSRRSKGRAVCPPIPKAHLPEARWTRRTESLGAHAAWQRRRRERTRPRHRCLNMVCCWDEGGSSRGAAACTCCQHFASMSMPSPVMCAKCQQAAPVLHRCAVCVTHELPGVSLVTPQACCCTGACLRCCRAWCSAATCTCCTCCSLTPCWPYLTGACTTSSCAT